MNPKELRKVAKLAYRAAKKLEKAARKVDSAETAYAVQRSDTLWQACEAWTEFADRLDYASILIDRASNVLKTGDWGYAD